LQGGEVIDELVFADILPDLVKGPQQAEVFEGKGDRSPVHGGVGIEGPVNVKNDGFDFIQGRSLLGDANVTDACQGLPSWWRSEFPLADGSAHGSDQG
jgi:hypothetical protein